MNKFKTYIEFSKFRLALTVVISAVITYCFAVDYIETEFSWLNVLWVSLGGFLVTAASNGLNQVIEVELDKLMDRTKNRPLPTERMSVNEALIVSGVAGL